MKNCNQIGQRFIENDKSGSDSNPGILRSDEAVGDVWARRHHDALGLKTFLKLEYFWTRLFRSEKGFCRAARAAGFESGDHHRPNPP